MFSTGVGLQLDLQCRNGTSCRPIWQSIETMLSIASRFGPELPAATAFAERWAIGVGIAQ